MQVAYNDLLYGNIISDSYADDKTSTSRKSISASSLGKFLHLYVWKLSFNIHDIFVGYFVTSISVASFLAGGGGGGGTETSKTAQMYRQKKQHYFALVHS